MEAQYMGIDQWGQTFLPLVHPRQDLMELLGYRSARKMYVDLISGGYRHKGYVIGPHWVSVYRVLPFKEVPA